MAKFFRKGSVWEDERYSPYNKFPISYTLEVAMCREDIAVCDLTECSCAKGRKNHYHVLLWEGGRRGLFEFLKSLKGKIPEAEEHVKGAI